MKRKLALLLSLVMVLSLLTACSEDSAKSSRELPKENNGVSGKTYVIKLAHVLADSTASAQACVYFKELVEERTNENVEVQVFSASALGNERDINENLNNGSIQMIYSSPGAMGNVFYPELQVLDAPWLFSSMEQAVAAGRDSNSTIGGFIKDIYDNTNVQILDMWYRAPRHIFTANTKITTPADCTGLKLRSPEIDVYFGALAAIGFSVTPVAYAETYTAIQTGVVEGLENPFDLCWGMKFQEVTSYCSKLGWNSGLGPVAINKNFYNSLPEEYQTIISEATIEAGDYSNKLTIDGDMELEQQFIDAGVEMVEPDIAAFKAMLPEIIPQISDIWNDNGRDIYSQIQSYQA
nr:TRAP transporter substrate-binding protein [uncultured Oscillibacter sp.]